MIWDLGCGVWDLSRLRAAWDFRLARFGRRVLKVKNALHSWEEGKSMPAFEPLAKGRFRQPIKICFMAF